MLQGLGSLTREELAKNQSREPRAALPASGPGGRGQRELLAGRWARRVEVPPPTKATWVLMLSIEDTMVICAIA